MYKILKRRELNPTVTLLEVEAPRVAAKAKAGQFVILIPDEGGERIPLTVAGCDKETGAVTVIFQIVGAKVSARSPSSEAASDALSRCPSPAPFPSTAPRSTRSSVSETGISSSSRMNSEPFPPL